MSQPTQTFVDGEPAGDVGALQQVETAYGNLFR